METTVAAVAEKHLRIGYSLYSPYYERCAFEKPITCRYPGASMEAVRLLEKFYNAKFEFVNYKGYGFGAPTESDTIFRGLLNGSVETAGATMWYISERVNNLPNFSFPMDTEALVAVLKTSSSLISIGTPDLLNLSGQGTIWAVLLVFAIFYYFAYTFFEYLPRNYLWISKDFLIWGNFVFSLLILIYLNFLANTIAILLYNTPPKQLPFRTFDQMADALLDGKIQLVAMDSASGRFTSPGIELAKTDPTLMKFYQANQISGRVVLVNTVGDAFKHVEEEGRVYVVNLLTAQGVPNICDYEIITDHSFPEIPFGFFFSNVSGSPWFRPDGPLIQSTRLMFKHYMKSYVFPHRCVNLRPRDGLSIQQTSTMFYLLLAGLFIGFFSLMWEIFHKEKMKRYQWINVSKRRNGFSGPSGENLDVMKRLELEYEVKMVVDGIYDHGNDLWVCFNRKMQNDSHSEIKSLQKKLQTQSILEHRVPIFRTKSE